MPLNRYRPFLLNILHVLRNANSKLELAFKAVAGACLGTLVVVVFIDVLFRQVINDPLLWPSEIAVLVFVWSVICGAAVSARRRAHFVVDVLPQNLSSMINTAVKLGVVAFSVAFALVLFIYGTEMAQTGLQRFTPMKGYPMIYHFVAFPVGGAAILLFAMEHFLEVLTGTSPDERSYSFSSSAPESDAK